MPFKLIHGTFHVTDYKANSGGIWFKASNGELWNELEGAPAINNKQYVQVKLEGIDTLETHYLNCHQPRFLGLRAFEYLLKKLGITNVSWDSEGSGELGSSDGTEGYILARSIDRYGRVVAFIYPGLFPEFDGSDIFLDEDLLRESINYKMLGKGMAYPAFYRGLFFDLREELSRVCELARTAQNGVFLYDKTNKGVEVSALRSVTHDQVIMPKLFRRLVKYCDGQVPDMRKFEHYLEHYRSETILLLDTRHFTHFDSVVKVDHNVMTLIVRPENIVFLG